MGEIGISRHEFLYEVQFWEVRRIIRGYRKRDKIKHQLIAECAFAAMHVFRKTEGKTPKDFFPSIFDDEEDVAESEIVNDKEVERLRRLMREENARNLSSKAK